MRKVIFQHGFFLFAAIVFISGCTPYWGGGNHRSEICSKNTDVFNGLKTKPLSKIIETIGALNMSEQYDLYLYGIRCFHPGVYVAGPIADRGENALDFLLGKLNAAKSDRDVIDIVFIFSIMEKRKSYHVQGDEKLLAALTKAVSTVKSKFWRKTLKDDLKELSRTKGTQELR